MYVHVTINKTLSLGGKLKMKDINKRVTVNKDEDQNFGPRVKLENHYVDLISLRSPHIKNGIKVLDLLSISLLRNILFSIFVNRSNICGW